MKDKKQTGGYKSKKKDMYTMEIDGENGYSMFFIRALGNKVNFHMDYSDVNLTISEVDELIAILKQARKDAVQG